MHNPESPLSFREPHTPMKIKLKFRHKPTRSRRPLLEFTKSKLAALAVIACLTSCTLLPASKLPKQGEVHVLLHNKNLGKTWSIPLETYVVGVVLAELSIASQDPATAKHLIEVQGLVTRTYAISNIGRHADDGYDLCDTTHCQVFHDPQTHTPELRKLARMAVYQTAGKIIIHKNLPIQALFHSNCGGHTSSADTIWGGTKHPYLTARPDSYCTIESPSSWQWSIDVNKLFQALHPHTNSNIGSELTSVKVIERDIAGRNTKIELNGTYTLRGETFRTIVMNNYGASSIRSTRFTVRRNGEAFTFAGTGYGHGAGLCQAGMLARILDGKETTEILSHYYPDTTIGSYQSSIINP